MVAERNAYRDRLAKGLRLTGHRYAAIITVTGG